MATIEDTIRTYPSRMNDLMRQYDFLICKDRCPILERGIECGEGWYDVIKELFQDLADATTNDGEIAITQIKEKFGQLTVYCLGYSLAVESIDRAQEKASHICELCGSNNARNAFCDTLHRRYQTLCQICEKRREGRK